MRNRAIYILSALAILLLVRNLYVMLLQVPENPEQGPIYRLIYFQLPAACTAFTCFAAALAASILYLVGREFRYDSLAVAITEVSMAFAMVDLVTGSIRARLVWGFWWIWDARLTTMFIGLLLALSYLVLRTAIDEPSRRALLSAVFSIFAFVDLPVVWYAIDWFHVERPGPSLQGEASPVLYWNWPALMLVAAILVLLRFRQEEMRREIDGLRSRCWMLDLGC